MEAHLSRSQNAKLFGKRFPVVFLRRHCSVDTALIGAFSAVMGSAARQFIAEQDAMLDLPGAGVREEQIPERPPPMRLGESGCAARKWSTNPLAFSIWLSIDS